MIRSDSEFLQFALSHYDNPQLSSLEEFESDLARFTYINNLLCRYIKNTSDLKEKLLVNHYVILSNCFSVSGSIKMCRYKIRQEYQQQSDTIMYHLGWLNSVNCLDFQLLNILQQNEN